MHCDPNRPPDRPTPTASNRPTNRPANRQVVKNNWYGFLSWMGDMEGLILMDSNNYDKVTTYDLVRRQRRGGSDEPMNWWRGNAMI